MPNAYLQGIQNNLDNQAQIRNDVSVVAINWFVNRCPLVTRLPRVARGFDRLHHGQPRVPQPVRHARGRGGPRPTPRSRWPTPARS